MIKTSQTYIIYSSLMWFMTNRLVNYLYRCIFNWIYNHHYLNRIIVLAIFQNIGPSSFIGTVEIISSYEYCNLAPYQRTIVLTSTDSIKVLPTSVSLLRFEFPITGISCTNVCELSNCSNSVNWNMCLKFEPSV